MNSDAEEPKEGLPQATKSAQDEALRIARVIEASPNATPTDFRLLDTRTARAIGIPPQDASGQARPELWQEFGTGRIALTADDWHIPYFTTNETEAFTLLQTILPDNFRLDLYVRPGKVIINVKHPSGQSTPTSTTCAGDNALSRALTAAALRLWAGSQP